MVKGRFYWWRYILFTVIIPVAVTFLLSMAFCIVEKNYYYLPYELDFLVDLTYNSLYYFLYIVLFIIVGVSVYLTAEHNVKTIIITTIIGVISTVAVLPSVGYLVRVIFLSSTADVNAMWEYFFSDLLSGVENGVRYITSILVAIAVRVFFKLKKIPANPKKPYVLPISAPQIALAIFYLAWLLLAVISFIFDAGHKVTSLVIEAALAIGGYFIGVLGILFAEKKLIKEEK